MGKTGITLTETDRQILQSYRNVVAGLENYLGEGYEIVLHSLESMEHSVIAIANGHHTGRQEGSPITDLALHMLHSIEEEEQTGFISYFSKNRKGEPLRSSTIVIYGENHRAIGLLCFNFYLNTSVYTVVANLMDESKSTPPMITETFVDNAEDLLSRVVEQVRQDVNDDGRILPSLKNKEIIRRCHAQGVFQIKNAVSRVAQLLGISKNTVYLHLRALQ
ncbi:MAG: hypothetical protein HFG03_03625 [Oscillibacter sp.]|jgi:predicted transcriptional regulator YheO|nr:hypothetical protein [Oscillibacter sp.]